MEPDIVLEEDVEFEKSWMCVYGDGVTVSGNKTSMKVCKIENLKEAVKSGR